MNDALPSHDEPWTWPDEEWRRRVNQVRAGRSLRPKVWPGGARCAVALSFDSDHETNELRDGGRSIGRMSWGQYGSRVGVPRILELVRPLGYLFAALPMTFDEGTPKERHVQRVSKLEGEHHLILDLIVADAALTGFLEGHVDVALPEGSLSVVSRDTLLKMKRLAARAQDLADIEALERDDEA